MSDVFLGEPPHDIKQWILDNTPYWTKFGWWIKSFNTAKLPQVGSYVTVPYRVDPEGDAVNTEWQILGYNKSIPSRIRYINGNDEIFVPTMIGNELSAIGEGTPVYSGKETTEPFESSILSVSEEIKVNPGNEINGVGHTYGNNNPYDAPKSVNFNGKDWNFAGYNATIMSKCGLAAKYGGNLYVHSQFDSQNHNDWKTSDTREWLNGTEAISTQKWYPQSGSATTGTIVGLLGRLTDTNFMKNIIPTVNRTWVYSSWRTDQSVEVENYVDKFWLLGEGNANVDKSYFTDDLYDTSKFTDIFKNDNSRKRKYMNEDGTEGSNCYWWLHSAVSNFFYYVGCISSYGIVSYYSANSDEYSAVLPVCLIG